MANSKARIRIREFKIGDYATAARLWAEGGIKVRPGDDRRNVQTAVRRNPGLSVVAVDGKKVVGTLMGRWDGRRGWISHLAVAKTHREHGIASRLLAEAESRMRRIGVVRTNIHLYASNKDGRALVKRHGYAPVNNLITYGKTLRGRR